jgi:PTH1 family peptidyl-tRNA hydrolase
VGIGRPGKGSTVVEHVLGVPHDPIEREALDEGILLAAQAALELCRGKTIEEVSRVYNKRNGSR